MNDELLKLISRKEVQEKQGKLQAGDIVYDLVTSEYHIVHNQKGILDVIHLWLPLPIDQLDYILNRPKEERRGVWEWIDWDKVYQKEISLGGKLSLYTLSLAEGKESPTFTGNPLEVLLKVFLFQKGVKV